MADVPGVTIKDDFEIFPERLGFELLAGVTFDRLCHGLQFLDAMPDAFQAFFHGLPRFRAQGVGVVEQVAGGDEVVGKNRRARPGDLAQGFEQQ